VRLEYQMDDTKYRRKNNGSGPEAYALPQCFERVTAKQKLFRETQCQHRGSPQHGIRHQFSAVQR
jgi:ribosomal protein L44E